MQRLYGDFELDLGDYRLLRRGREVPIEPRTMDLLCYLAARPNRLIAKDELLREVWKLQSLSDGVLTNTIGKLRQVLGQDAKAAQPIETVRGRGYRWRATETAACKLREQYVGRSVVLATLVEALTAAQSGKGTLLMLMGEPGIGKTRTLDELAQRAAAESLKVYNGAAYEAAGAPAFWPWVEVLRAAHAQLGESAFRSMLPAAATALPLLVPELLGHRAGGEAEQPALRFQLFDELTLVLSALAPCLIVLDDLHWADAGTLELLAYAARALAKRPIVFAVALRAHALRAQPALHRLERCATRIALSGLSEREVSQLAAALPFGAALDASASGALHRRTQGNPLFVRQMLALLAERALVPDAACVEAVELPAAVHSVLRQRIEELNPGLRQTLAAASVIGTELEIGLLHELLGTPVEELLHTLEAAQRAGVVERRPGVVHRFVFVHALLREALYDSLSLRDAGALHAKLARALEARLGERDPRQLAELARHALRALPCDLAACLRHCMRAADAARQASGFEAAAELLSLALDKCSAEGGDPNTACDLLLALAFDQLCANALDAAAQTLERGVSLCRELGRADLLTGFACRMADWLEFSGNEPRARMHLEYALERVAERDLRSRVLLLGRVARLRPELSLTERRALFAQAEALATELAEPELSIDLAFCRASMRDPSEAHTIDADIARYRELCRRFPSAHAGIRDEMRGLNVVLTEYMAASTRGDMACADRSLLQLKAAAERCQVPAVSSAVELVAAGRLLAQGELPALETTIQRRLESLDHDAANGPEGGWFMVAWLVARARGALAPWAALEVKLEAGLANLRNAQHEVFIRVWFAWLYAHTGRAALATDALRWVTPARLTVKPAHYGDLGLLCQMAEIACLLEQRELARTLRARLTPFADRHALGMLGESWGAVSHYLGMLAALLDNPQQMRQQLERAVAAHTRWCLPLALARSEALLARCL